ncbi:MAG TPA: lytic transglycosylase domain-containing protein [Pyrinomonadaceae bacterium]|nr:lytic transglycosylase domain-containing protein [Pyrinomonadaceae bacterium]
MKVFFNNKRRCLMLLSCSVFLFTTSALGQVQSRSAKERETTSESPEIEHYLDRLIATAVVAGDSATAVKEADAFRAEANQKLKSGERDEARSLLRQAGEVIAAAAPEGDAKQQDPLLREYLRDITRELVALDAPSRSVALAPIDGNFFVGNYSTQPRVTAFLTYFQGRGRSRLEIGRARLAVYRPMMAQVFREEGVPEWLLSVGFVESTYNTSAHSPKAAHGIWQFIPGTGDRYGLKRTAWVDERSNPEKSTRAAARYLRDLNALFGDWLLAVAAYNWGEGRVAKVTQRTGIRDLWTLADRGFLPQETTNYVPAVLAASHLLFGNTKPTDQASELSIESDQPPRIGPTRNQEFREQKVGQQ